MIIIPYRNHLTAYWSHLNMNMNNFFLTNIVDNFFFQLGKQTATFPRKIFLSAHFYLVTLIYKVTTSYNTNNM